MPRPRTGDPCDSAATAPRQVAAAAPRAGSRSQGVHATLPPPRAAEPTEEDDPQILSLKQKMAALATDMQTAQARLQALRAEAEAGDGTLPLTHSASGDRSGSSSSPWHSSSDGDGNGDEEVAAATTAAVAVAVAPTTTPTKPELWCTHDDCIESSDTFTSEALLAAHTQQEHGEGAAEVLDEEEETAEAGEEEEEEEEEGEELGETVLQEWFAQANSAKGK
eukprot:COSAG01_NODE_17969_length_1110_cov_1.488625_1_plen_221_part_10